LEWKVPVPVAEQDSHGPAAVGKDDNSNVEMAIAVEVPHGHHLGNAINRGGEGRPKRAITLAQQDIHRSLTIEIGCHVPARRRHSPMAKTAGGSCPASNGLRDTSFFDCAWRMR